ncbi:hypothetical protein NUU61_001940 [Penicillium alfredii]|uniref:Fatty acyl-CoA reductase n=1 Tax=Penicillium alfredii TaxID=1506179 RepID=A0A9W9KGD3_9EURO|nr:uncharacterized protein NUU61_001940 [Penicillium alfredii]KAJ5104593.1 hypothetical protein NUU61_001940 [Penicillium alfredii]
MTSLWEKFRDKNILITGGSGFLGTAIVHRLVTKAAAPGKIYILCRGGRDSLEKKWREWLGTEADALLSAHNLIVLQGDIETMDVDTALDGLKLELNVIIHVASTINLARPLKQIKNMIVYASLKLAELGEKCENLERFVYVSTAYANANLYQSRGTANVTVDEQIYTYGNDTTVDEFEELVKSDESIRFHEFVEQFPYAYTYAKHLTERLLQKKLGDRLLIVRPSIIGPAQSYPFRGYSMPLSTPSTLFSAAIMLTPSRSMVLATRANNPMVEATSDEVPVDVVADRLLAHLAYGTTGPVHAVSGRNALSIFQNWWQECMKERRLPWKVNPVWRPIDWRSPELHPISRTTVLFGTSFEFSDDKTGDLFGTLNDEEKVEWELYTQKTDTEYDLSQRRQHIRYCMKKIAKRSAGARMLIRVFYRKYGAK